MMLTLMAATPLVGALVVTVMPRTSDRAAAVKSVAVGAALGFFLYSRQPIAGEMPADSLVSIFARAGRHELYGNELNDAVVVRPTRHLTRFLVFLDGKGIDGFVTGLADRLGDASQALRKPQTGFVRSYALSFFAGAVVIVLALLAVTLA